MNQYASKQRGRRKMEQATGLVMSVLGLVGVLSVLWMFAFTDRNTDSTQVGLPPAAARDSAPDSSDEIVDEGVFPRLEIPALGVVAAFENVGVDTDGNMRAPSTSDIIAWYEGSRYPGQGGNAVLAGHVDTARSVNGGVFGGLAALTEGAAVRFVTESKTITYKLSFAEIYPYDETPADLVFGSSTTDRLTLITCSGRWNSEKNTYDDRLVVIAERAE